MENRDKETSAEGGKNPTLDSPGSQVADYGNPTGGSSNDNPEAGDAQETDKEGKTETIGTP